MERNLRKMWKFVKVTFCRMKEEQHEYLGKTNVDINDNGDSREQ
jgi:hypothetical protein